MLTWQVIIPHITTQHNSFPILSFQPHILSSEWGDYCSNGSENPYKYSPYIIKFGLPCKRTHCHVNLVPFLYLEIKVNYLFMIKLQSTSYISVDKWPGLNHSSKDPSRLL